VLEKSGIVSKPPNIILRDSLMSMIPDDCRILPGFNEMESGPFAPSVIGSRGESETEEQITNEYRSLRSYPLPSF
jgi:hypothetical protein